MLGFVSDQRFQGRRQEFHAVYVALPFEAVMCLITFQLATKYFADLQYKITDICYMYLVSV